MGISKNAIKRDISFEAINYQGREFHNFAPFRNLQTARNSRMTENLRGTSDSSSLGMLDSSYDFLRPFSFNNLYQNSRNNIEVDL